LNFFHKKKATKEKKNDSLIRSIFDFIFFLEKKN